MKTEEDEAFEAIERRQGGFQTKRAMAADKLHWSDCAVHNGPAYPAGKCDCGVAQEPERKALKLALEVMQINLTLLKKVNPYKGQEDLVSDSLDLTHKAITAIKEALAQPAPQREWVGLTDEEIRDCLGPEAVCIPPGWSKLTRAIEAKLKEKNT